MSHLAWMAVCGALLLFMALTSAYIQRVPISTSIIYLAVGVALGPVGLDAIRIDMRTDGGWLERFTEVAVIVSLFVGGVKLRLPLRDPAWRAPLRLAGPLMLLCIAGVAVLSHLVLDLPVAASLLLGAILAPTDPVLASAVQVEGASDHDRMRYGLSGEAGLNDGAAFPFVVLALLWGTSDGFGDWLAGWAAHRILWAIPAGLLLGYGLGRLVGRLAVHLRSRERDDSSPSDFLALALIALAYVGAEAIGAWGFLAVFAAGMGLRGAELRVVRDAAHPGAATLQGQAARPVREVPSQAGLHPPPAENVIAKLTPEALAQPSVAAGSLLAEVLSFGDTAERLLEVMLVFIVGVALAEHWDPRALGLAFVLMVVLRPLATQLVLLATPTNRRQRWLMGWFGIRGIGSLYYLAYAINQGLPAGVADDVSGLTISVVAISIVVHGTTAQPLLGRYARSLAARALARAKFGRRRRGNAP